jgi:hypothetical protein
MGESQRVGESGGLYERLLQRLALALDEAEGLSKLSAEPSQVLELRGLTSAELELIHAYLNRDLDWLRGWHAAAREMAQIRQLPAQRLRAGRILHKPMSSLPIKAKPLLKRRMQLCCALCGTLAGWRNGVVVQACTVCGSQLFRASNSR